MKKFFSLAVSGTEHAHTCMSIKKHMVLLQKMASRASPMYGESKQAAAAFQLYPRLQKCWERDIDWSLIPEKLKQVSCYLPSVCMHGFYYHSGPESTISYQHLDIETPFPLLS